MVTSLHSVKRSSSFVCLFVFLWYTYSIRSEQLKVSNKILVTMTRYKSIDNIVNDIPSVDNDSDTLFNSSTRVSPTAERSVLFFVPSPALGPEV